MLKKIAKKIVVTILNWESRLILKKYKPKLIGVTGNVGKTSTKEAIASVMETSFNTRKNTKSYNSEFGVPLTIIGCPSAWSSLSGWLNVIYRGLILILLDNDYPEWLVLEVGADRPGDIKNIVKWIKFDVGVVSRLPDMPVHIEFFKSKEQVIDEKMSLPLSLRSNGVAILNADDPNIMSRRDKIKAKVITYGFSEGADVRAENDHVMYEGEGDNAIPTGFAFKVICQGSNVPVRVFGTIGTHLVYPVLAAIAVGVAQGINLVKAIEALADHLPPPGRLHLVPGMNGSTILDDTYNSSPIALEAALTALSELKKAGNGRKIAVIGDMMELGSHTAEAHKKIGEMAATICDEIITVGVRAKFAHEQALAKGFSSERAFHFSNSVEAGEWLKDKINKNDIILVKGSQSSRMEKVVVAIMAEPGKRKELLVRQEDEWLNI